MTAWHPEVDRVGRRDVDEYVVAVYERLRRIVHRTLEHAPLDDIRWSKGEVKARGKRPVTSSMQQGLQSIRALTRRAPGGRLR